jgi:diguanylate cyclase (GGDEF)-like protein
MTTPAMRPHVQPSGAPSSWSTRAAVWTTVGVLCLIGGGVGSVFGAKSVAHTDATTARQSFKHNSTAIAEAVKGGIEHEEDLGIAAATFVAGNPGATPYEFARWAKWARTLVRYPELQSLSVVSLVRVAQLHTFEARAARTTLASLTARPAPAPALKVTPASRHRYYCLTATELTRSPAPAPAGLDACARTHTLLLARETGQRIFTEIPEAGSQALSILDPVYRGNATPLTLKGRSDAFAGWLREVFQPGVVVQRALAAHPGYAAKLRYAGPYASSALFEAGGAQDDGQSTLTNLTGGWTLGTVGPKVSGGIFADGTATTLLLSGILLSALLGILLYSLGTGAGTGTGRAPLRPPAREVPNEDLYDTLTGLPNRALTLDRAGRMVARASRQSGMLAGALMIDIDWFKEVNEKFGTAAADKLLSIVGERLANVVRGQDTVGRLGGDEFVVLVESAARGVRLDNLARRMIESLHKPVDLDGSGADFTFTASIGVAFGRYETPDDLLRDSKLALLAAKSAGKDRYTLFNANMRAVIEGRSVLETELNAALLDKQFFLLYEPIYDLSTGKVFGVESLLRWQHPKQGVLEPEAFLSLAEETGLIVPIGRWELESACANAAAWDVSGHRAEVAVRISPNQFNREGIITDVRRALQQSGLDPSLLSLQIAETTVMRDVAEAAARLQELKQLGVRISIDEFGSSGYAYHSDLRRLPLDALKVDKSSLAAAEDEDYRSWLLEAILIVGRELSLKVVAKGLETREQVSALHGMGCTMAQGAFMGEPAAPGEVEAVLETKIPISKPSTANTAPALWPEGPSR